MEIRWLNDFLAVAQTHSFTKAAELRHTSQAALSRRIQQLEAWLGARLIDRAVYPSRLTAQGERFVEQATEMLKLAAESRQEASKGIRSSSNSLRIALPLFIATHLLPMWWRTWFVGRSTPNCEAIPTNLHDAVTALVSESADLLLCYVNPLLPIQLESGRFDRHVLMRDTLRPYAAPSLVERMRSSGDTLMSERTNLLLFSEGTYLGQLVREIMETHELQVTGHRTFRSDMADVLCEMSVEGHGIAWLPGCCADVRVARGELMGVGDDRWSLELSYTAYRNLGNRNPALLDVWNAMRGEQGR
nr:LysR family transcriptional regulator [Nitrosomonas nitrosa]